jgi:hypothetical protein
MGSRRSFTRASQRWKRVAAPLKKERRRASRSSPPSTAKPAVSVSANASTIPITSRIPNDLTIGTGDSSRTRKPAAVAAPAVAITGPPARAACAARSAWSPPASGAVSLNLDWNWIA